MSETTIPKTQKTLYYDSPTNVFLKTDAPVPEPDFSAGDHLIKVQAFALCAGELTWYQWVPIPGKDLIPGYDLCGIVISAPQDSPFQSGARVYGRTNYARPGVAREYAIAKTEELALVPKHLADEELAATALSALTAWQALFERAGLPSEPGSAKGKRIVVTAASGGVGLWAVQIAKLIGAEAIGTCGPDNIEFVKSLGADEAINYRSSSIKKWAEGKSQDELADLVFCCAGGPAVTDAWYAVKDGGAIVSVAGPLPPDDLKPKDFQREPKIHEFFIMHPDGKNLATITKWLEEGHVKPVVDSVYGFEDFRKAFERSDGGHARGKVVVKL